MPLLNLIETFKTQGRLAGEFHGVVVGTDAGESSKRRRVKCSISELWPDDNITLMPWVYPRCSVGLGGGPNSSGFVVPEIGAHLIIKFPYRSIYAPCYVGYWDTSLTHNTRFDTNYPEVYGWEDPKGTFITVDKTSRVANLTHQSGATVTIQADGTIVMKPAEGKKIQLDNDAGDTLQPLPRGEDLYKILLLFLQHGHDTTIGPTQALATVSGEIITPASPSFTDVIAQIQALLLTVRSDYNEVK